MLNVKLRSFRWRSRLALWLSLSTLYIHLPATFSAPGWIMSFHVLITERSVCWVLSPLAHSTLVPWISEDCCARLHVLCILPWLVFYHSAFSFLPFPSPVAFSSLASLGFSGSLHCSGSLLRIVLDYGCLSMELLSGSMLFHGSKCILTVSCFSSAYINFSILGFVNSLYMGFECFNGDQVAFAYLRGM